LNAPHREFPVLEERVLLPALLPDATRMNFMRFCELIELAAPNAPSLGSTDSPASVATWQRGNAILSPPHPRPMTIRAALRPGVTQQETERS
jgi:type VI secretion system protein ImpH